HARGASRAAAAVEEAGDAPELRVAAARAGRGRARRRRWNAEAVLTDVAERPAVPAKLPAHATLRRRVAGHAAVPHAAPLAVLRAARLLAGAEGACLALRRAVLAQAAAHPARRVLPTDGAGRADAAAGAILRATRALRALAA